MSHREPHDPPPIPPGPNVPEAGAGFQTLPWSNFPSEPRLRKCLLCLLKHEPQRFRLSKYGVGPRDRYITPCRGVPMPEDTE